MGAQQGAPPPGSPGSYPPAGGQPAPGDPYAGFHEGATVANRYRLEKMIGKGGMAMVFKATDTDLEEEVALKVFLTIDDSTMIERFKQELKLSRKLNHPNIIRLYDIGVFNHRRYISMELLRGDTLKNMLGDPLPFAQGMDYLIQSARGLHVAHEKGVIHRDIKPDNLFVTEDGKVKVMDFGIAKQQSTRGLTATGMIAGTPEYMSPEQINNFSKVGPSTDLYALGIVAYEMFTGRVPFWDEELMTLLIMHVTRPPRPPSKRNPEIPPPLEKCILKLLQKDPAMRHPTCQDLADELEKLSAQFG